MKTVVGLFDSFDDAQNVMEALAGLGIGRETIRIENEGKGEFAFETAGEGRSDRGGALLGGLMNLGVPRDDAQIYAEGVRRGGTLLIVSTSDDKAVRAYELMSQHGSIDLDERMKTWQKSGWSGFGATSGTETTATKTTAKTKTTGTTQAREVKQGEQVIPVVEEEMRVGKREVQKGGIRVYSHVTERPVEEQVHLREEHVHVERRPVDRPVSDLDMKTALKDQTIEMREKSEEAVVQKRSRVIEEVVIGKEVTGRTETVRDTVKRTDVDVQKIEGERTVSAVRFEEFDKDFRTHYKGLKLQDSSYDEFLPVYRYGYSLGTNEQYRGKDWNAIEPDARRYWEERNPGTWERFKDSVRYAWDKVRGRR